MLYDGMLYDGIEISLIASHVNCYHSFRIVFNMSFPVKRDNYLGVFLFASRETPVALNIVWSDWVFSDMEKRPRKQRPEGVEMTGGSLLTIPG